MALSMPNGKRIQTSAQVANFLGTFFLEAKIWSILFINYPGNNWNVMFQGNLGIFFGLSTKINSVLFFGLVGFDF